MHQKKRFYLEEWIHHIVRSVLDTPSITRTEIEAYQWLRLRQTIQLAYQKSSFYRRLFMNVGMLPDDIRSPADLARLPFTEPCHLSESPYRFLCVSQSEVARPYTFVTSGTTGPQKKIFWSSGDLERISEFMAAGIATVADAGDIVQIMLADGRPYSQADLLSRGVSKLGATPVLADMNLAPEEFFRILTKAHSTILFGYTGRMFRLSQQLRGHTDLHAAGLRCLFLAGEYLPGAMRRKLQKMWNCAIRTHYGLTEMGLGVAVECEAGDGYHFNEAGLMLEVIDPETGKAVPPGDEGELVFTTLARDAMPLIRYRTHDLSRLLPGPCACGAASLLKFDAVRMRRESVVALDGGGRVYPSMFDDVLFEVPGVLDYRVALTRHEGRQRLEFAIETLQPTADALSEMHRKILSIPVIDERVAAGTLAHPLIAFAAADALRSIGREKKLIVTT